MQHYHVNRNAYFNENINQNINQNINKNKNYIPSIIINQNNNFLNESNINNIIYIQKIYNQIFFDYNNSEIFDIFLINKNINISELLNYIYSKSIKLKIKNIYILSVENIDIYKF